jgi:hypothetical protein
MDTSSDSPPVNQSPLAKLRELHIENQGNAEVEYTVSSEIAVTLEAFEEDEDVMLDARDVRNRVESGSVMFSTTPFQTSRNVSSASSPSSTSSSTQSSGKPNDAHVVSKPCHDPELQKRDDSKPPVLSKTLRIRVPPFSSTTITVRIIPPATLNPSLYPLYSGYITVLSSLEPPTSVYRVPLYVPHSL